MLAIGIDTGGTCTDAVVYDLTEKEVLASAKTLTTHRHLEEGIRNVIMSLPEKYLDEASYIALSTTLATNACVENKGGRVCMIFFGVDERTVRESYQKYGFEDMECMRFYAGDQRKKETPDWEAFEKMLEKSIPAYDSFALSQISPYLNDGAFEKEAAARIRKRTNKPVICAYEIFQDLNAIQRGAGAYLNARLIPIIEQFFQAVETVLQQLNIHIPFVIMRSDGSLVSAEYAAQYPVETLLCGPTASTKGGMALTDQKDVLIVDMGGTTTDVAIVKNGRVKVNSTGVKVGCWKTFIKGIEIDTFALGGDTHVIVENDSVMLGQERVIPITVLAEQYPDVKKECENLLGESYVSKRALYEHFVLIHPLASADRASEEERAICDCLKDGPRSVRQIAEYLHLDGYRLNTARLEKEGIIQRSGFTPTDAMIVRGDYTAYNAETGNLVLQYIKKITKTEPEEVLASVYEQVCQRLYCNLVRILWQDKQESDQHQRAEKLRPSQKTYAAGYVGEKTAQKQEILAEIAEQAYAVSQDAYFAPVFHTKAVLVGVGAPTHVFLPKAAKMLGTGYQNFPYSAVSNALGAVLGDVAAEETVKIVIEYKIGAFDEEGAVYHVYGDEEKEFEKYDPAISYAKECAVRRAKQRAYKCGAGNIYERSCEVKEQYGNTALGKVFMGSEVTAHVKGKFT